jgi:dTDP-4-dehydrorhamnose reductase
MNILITGASGLLGSKIAEITPKTYRVYSGYNTHQAQYGEQVFLDITKPGIVKQVFELTNPDVVIHCAALTSVDYCERNPELAYQINVNGTKNIVSNSEEKDSYLVHISTDYVFDGQKGDYKEHDQTNPINTYGKTKLESERIFQESSIDYCIARTSVIYGNRPAAGKENFVLWLIKSLHDGKQVNIITDQLISPTYNHNLAEMIFEASIRRLMGIYHLAGASHLNRYTFSKKVAREFNLNEELINPVTSSEMNWNAQRPKNSTLNTSKARQTLSHKPLKIEQALKQLHDELKYEYS